MVLADSLAGVSDFETRRRHQFIRRHRWWLAAVALVVAVAIAATLFVRWLDGDTALKSGPPGATLGSPIKVGQTSYTPPMVFSASENGATVDIRSVVPRLTANSADAQFRPLLCKRNNSIQVLGGSSLTSYSWCRTLIPGEVTIGPDAGFGEVTIILAVTARHLGAVRIEGVHVDCRQGVRHGTANSGIEDQMWTGSTNPFSGP